MLEGCCHYESLVDGTIDLFDVVRLNDALTVRNENERRMRDAAERR